eukprot:tig00020965_g16870.t1
MLIGAPAPVQVKLMDASGAEDPASQLQARPPLSLLFLPSLPVRLALRRARTLALARFDTTRKAAGACEELANLCADRGRYDRALPLLQRAMAIRTGAQERHGDVAVTLDLLARLYRSLGRLDEAETRLQLAVDVSAIAAHSDSRPPARPPARRAQRALQIREAVLGKDHPEVAATLIALSLINTEQGDYGEAEDLAMRATRIRERALGGNHPKGADCVRALAALRAAQGRLADAEQLCRRALELQKSALGRSHPEVAGTEHQLAGVCERQGRLEEAEERYLRALAVREARFAFNHPHVAETLAALVSLLMRDGFQKRLEDFLKECVEVGEALLGLAALATRERRHAAAEPLLRRALEVAEQRGGPPARAAAAAALLPGALSGLAAACAALGRRPEAVALYKAVALYRRLVEVQDGAGAEGADAETLHALGTLLRDEEPAAAPPRALAACERATGRGDVRVAELLLALGALAAATGRHADAEAHFERCMAGRREEIGSGRLDATGLAALRGLAAALAAQGRPDEAADALQRLLEAQEQTPALGPEHPDAADTLQALGAVRGGQGRAAEAEALLRRALALRERALAPSDPKVAESLGSLAALLAAQGRHADAEPLYRRCVAGLEKAGAGAGAPPGALREALSGLAASCEALQKKGEAAAVLQRLLTLQRTSSTAAAAGGASGGPGTGGTSAAAAAAVAAGDAGTELRLGAALARDRKLEQAEPHLRRALAGREAEGGADSPGALEAALALADLLKARPPPPAPPRPEGYIFRGM